MPDRRKLNRAKKKNCLHQGINIPFVAVSNISLIQSEDMMRKDNSHYTRVLFFHKTYHISYRVSALLFCKTGHYRYFAMFLVLRQQNSIHRIRKML